MNENRDNAMLQVENHHNFAWIEEHEGVLGVLEDDGVAGPER